MVEDKKIKHQYGRSLPLNKYNPLSWICEGACIGEDCWIGAFVYIADNVEIGHNCSISNGVQVFDHDNAWKNATVGECVSKKYNIKIGDHVHIGSNSVILPSDRDIIIGNNCIIGALSLVKSNIPAQSMVYGIPARIEGRIEIKVPHLYGNEPVGENIMENTKKIRLSRPCVGMNQLEKI